MTNDQHAEDELRLLLDAIHGPDAPSQGNGLYPWKDTTEGPVAAFHGYQVHITSDGEVWLNTEVSLFDGLCIGTRTFRDGDIKEAVQDAIATLELALVRLRAFHP